jgi:hypothetical protein
MGMCKGCNKVFNVVAMKDGLCEECYIKENGVSFNLSTTSEDKVVNETNGPVTPMAQGTKNILIGLGVAVALGAVYFIYNSITYPSDAVVKNIASQMINRPEDKIEIVSSYKSNGGIMMNLKIGQAICEMPMLNTDSDGWVGRGINCQGSLYE